jgi:hypothetical protein
MQDRPIQNWDAIIKKIGVAGVEAEIVPAGAPPYLQCLG